MRRFPILILIFTMSAGAVACKTSAPARTVSGRMPPIVFIHGIKGATLVNLQGQTQWLTGAQSLGLNSPDLALPMEWEGETQKRDILHSDRVLESVRIFPWLVEKAVYQPWLKAASEMGHPFYSFAYDWRRDCLENLQGFESFLNQVRVESHGSPIRVVAHSMGGLITLALLNERPELFESVVFAGVPFAGGIGFLKDLHAGESVGLNRKILSPDVLFTFPSVFALFPLGGQGLVAENGKPVAMDFFSAPKWAENRLSVFSEKTPPTALSFLEKALAHARKFRLQLIARKQKYPPIFVVASHVQQTLQTVIRDGPQSVRGWDFETAPKVPGDGRVALKDAMPPQGIPFQLISSEAEHSELLNDPHVIQAVRELKP
jgi:pimeloyl-ACP methyl ester carboxylesterase